ncbi:hypothetical protein [Qipengyuania sp. NPDC077563]|uniref:hypothetical protein n=1 Tax=Qipengyuania sp. NPDC077563 TaxID=3364497 RepID=UPI00384C3231
MSETSANMPARGSGVSRLPIYFIIAILLSFAGGYCAGKDMALRDNARDAREAAAAN